MIEREFIQNKVKNLKIKRMIEQFIPKNAGIGNIIVERTPLSETVTIDAVKPGLLIGRRGETIKKLTDEIKSKYKLDNPQIKVREIITPDLNAHAVARKIASDLERFGSRRFKAIGHRAISNILRAGALGAEIALSGKIPGARAKTWRFSDGYMKKCGEISDAYIDIAIESATLPAGVIGIQVRIMGAEVPLPDRVKIAEPVEEVKEEMKIAIKSAEETETKEEAAKAIKKLEKKDEKKAAPKPTSSNTDELKIRGTTEIHPTDGSKSKASLIEKKKPAKKTAVKKTAKLKAKAPKKAAKKESTKTKKKGVKK